MNKPTFLDIIESGVAWLQQHGDIEPFQFSLNSLGPPLVIQVGAPDFRRVFAGMPVKREHAAGNEKYDRLTIEVAPHVRVLALFATERQHPSTTIEVVTPQENDNATND